MAFVVEDGSGLENANSYVSLAFAEAYFEDRLTTAWTGNSDDDAKQAALIRATAYVDQRFKFKGEKFDEDQFLEFPRDEEDNVPLKLKQAVCEYALRALSGSLAPDPTTDDRGLQVASKTEKVGPLEESTVYVQNVRAAVFRPYPTADMLLRDLLINNRRVIR